MTQAGRTNGRRGNAGSRRQSGFARRERGVAAVEFAVVASVFFTLLIGIAEMGRLLWTWNAAAEATRRGARMAVVCSKDAPAIRVRMREMLPALADANITIAYFPDSCTAATCKEVSVSLTGYTHQTVIPFVPLSLPLPAFRTTLPREFMESSSNPVCN